MKNNIYFFPSHLRNVTSKRFIATVTATYDGIATQAHTNKQYIHIDKQAEHIRALCSGDNVIVEHIDGMNIITSVLLAANKKSPPSFIEHEAGIWSLKIGKAKITLHEIGKVHITTPHARIELNNDGYCLLDGDIQEIKGRMIKLN